MNVFKKTLNKLNGNLCFSAESESVYYVFECQRASESVSYTTSTKPIKDICQGTLQNYFVCFGDNQIGKFDGATLLESYSNVGSLTADLIIYGKTVTGNNYYIWSKNDNSISRIEMVGNVSTVIWTYDLNEDFTSCKDAELFFKPESSLIIFKGEGKIQSLRDLDTNAVFVGKTTVDSSNFVSISGDNYPMETYARTRMVWGKELEESSSSSSTSSSSSESEGNTTSSSSSSSTSSSSESSESIGNTSSSSSSSSSTSNSSSSSLDSSSSSSSESSSAFNDNYCVAGGWTIDARGTYSRTGDYRYEHPVYTNGTTFMFMHVYSGTLEWAIDYVVTDGTPGITFKLVTTQTPDGIDWYDGVTVTAGSC